MSEGDSNNEILKFFVQHLPEKKKEAVSLFMAGILLVPVFLEQIKSLGLINETVGIGLVTLAVLLVGFAFLSGLFLKVAEETPQPLNVIQGLILAAGCCFGKSYRLNVMELKQDRFYIKEGCQYNMVDPVNYNGVFDVCTPGVGTAYTTKRPVAIPFQDIQSDRDPFPKRIWSAPVIKDGTSLPIAIVNIDTELEALDDTMVTQTTIVCNNLAKIISDFYQLKLSTT